MASLLFPAMAASVPAQVAPGRYDERGLKSLDFVLETARKYGLQVILSFIDNWKYYNGVDQYVDW
jgi:mannan endo-1,4-beta-mannosidase